ncbi:MULTISPECIES: GreA/GreB family elongation factor [unclassified Exiguobacterium]|uniref:GreA/GreB family elongation factor n=1 Tax=unclassified Exiguobacterium TaxID=2644629 RepID=UPI001BEC4646|nr:MULTISPECIES: GreA/GreB family elongation factor [unclassified Exiguobacterium]
MKPQLTVMGHDQVKNRLATLKHARTVARERMRTARKFCDFREDVTYVEAVRDYERMEADILELERLLDDATIVESKQTDVVSFGNKVVIRERNDEETESYRIVSEAEADLGQGSISSSSPLGRNLIGATVGQIVHVESPEGTLAFEVLSIEA